MKLATYRDGTRDGQLVVVSRDLTRAHYCSHIVSRMQQALDDWTFYAPQLAALSDALNDGHAPHAFAFEPSQCLAPLPRPGSMLQAQCYEYPADFAHAAQFANAQPRPEQADCVLGVSDPKRPARAFNGPVLQALNAAGVCGARTSVSTQDWAAALGLDDGEGEPLVTGLGLDVCANVAVICTPGERAAAPRLFTLAAQVRLHALAHTSAHFHAAPLTAFAPVALSADELGAALDAQLRLHLPLRYSVNARKIGLCDAGVDQRWPWLPTLAHAARFAELGAGSVVLSGEIHQIQKTSEHHLETSENPENPQNHAEENQTHSPKDNPKKQPNWHFPQGHASLRARRLAEQWRKNPHKTPENPRELLKTGDIVDIQMSDRAGRDLFGNIQVRIE